MPKKLKPLLFVGGGIVLVAVLAFFVAPKILGGSLHIQVGGGQTEAAATVPTQTPEPAELHGIPVTLGERVVNLADPGGFRYLKVEIVLDLASEDVDPSKMNAAKLTEEQTKLGDELGGVKPQIQDIVTTVLTSKSVGDVSTTEGKEAMKAQLKEQLQPVVKDHTIVAVYFAQFLIQ
jgi:flagellar FliL protein